MKLYHEMSAKFRKREGWVIELLTDSMGPEIETSQGTTKVEKRPAVANHVSETWGRRDHRFIRLRLG